MTTLPPPGFFVSPFGKAANPGTFDAPWPLAHALAQPASYSPGSVIWLRGGTYTGTFQATMTGTTAGRCILRGYPGERAVIDGEITVGHVTTGYPYIDLVELEVKQSDPFRGSDQWVWDPAVPSGGVIMYSANGRLINCYIHDVANNCIGWWRPAEGSLIYGCWAHNGGLFASDRWPGGHGHGTYSQNDDDDPTKSYRHNVIGPVAGVSLDIFTQSLPVSHYNVSQCVFYGSKFSGIHALGDARMDDITVTDCQLWECEANWGDANHQQHGAVTFTNNRVRGRKVNFNYMETVTFTGNVITGAGNSDPPFPICTLLDPTVGNMAATIAGNTWHYTGPGTNVFGLPDASATNFAGWQGAGYDVAGSFDTDDTTVNATAVWPNEYRDDYSTRTGIVVIWNGAQTSTVNVDLSNLGMVKGRSYRFRNALNYDEFFTHPSDGQDNLVTVNMQAGSWSVALPTNWPEAFLTNPFPRFGTFIVERIW